MGEKSRKYQLELFSGVQMNAIDFGLSELIHQIQNIDIVYPHPINALNLLSNLRKEPRI
jgi:hypothetical protein